MKKLFTNKDGQVMILFAIGLAVLMGFVAMAVDVGAATATKAKMQSAADAAALAGAQELPESPSQAVTYAQTYAAANGINLSDMSISIENDDHNIVVSVNHTMPTYFARVLGKNSVDIAVDSTATSGYAASVPWIVPFAIPQPLEFNYDNPYVMRMYGGGKYPDNGFYYPSRYSSSTVDIKPYRYPDDYNNHPIYKNYPLTGALNVYKTIGSVNLKKDKSDTSQTLITIPANTVVTYITSEKTGTRYPQTWYNVTYGGKTGWAKKESFSINLGPGNIYPYHFDYMNVDIKKGASFDNYIEWLKNGYHEKFSVNQNMYFRAPSSGGPESWEAFGDRVQRDHNTDYTKAKVGDARVILIPIVPKLLERGTTAGTPMKIIGFTAFFIQSVHKNQYGTTAWFEGRFLENVNVAGGDVTFDPNADYGLRIVKLTK